MKSWRTTTSGLATILATLAHVFDAIADGKPIDFTVAIAGITTGIGLLHARDNKVTSEDAGARPPQ
jgi:hypothetical protein